MDNIIKFIVPKRIKKIKFGDISMIGFYLKDGTGLTLPKKFHNKFISFLAENDIDNYEHK